MSISALAPALGEDSGNECDESDCVQCKKMHGGKECGLLSREWTSDLQKQGNRT